jgi:hypothetical protein
MPTPTVRLQRRHHQPQTRRFREVCHLLGAFFQTFSYSTIPPPLPARSVGIGTGVANRGQNGRHTENLNPWQQKSFTYYLSVGHSQLTRRIETRSVIVAFRRGQ